MDTLRDVGSISEMFERIAAWIMNLGVFVAFTDMLEGIYAIPAVALFGSAVMSLPGIKQVSQMHVFMYQNEAFEIYRVIYWTVITLAIGQVLFYYVGWTLIYLLSVMTSRRNVRNGNLVLWDRFDSEVHENKPRHLIALIISPLLLLFYRAMVALRFLLSVTILFQYSQIFVYTRFVMYFKRDDFLTRVVTESTEFETRFTHRDQLKKLQKGAVASSKQARGTLKSERKQHNAAMTKLRNEIAELEAVIALADRQNKPPKSIQFGRRN